MSKRAYFLSFICYYGEIGLEGYTFNLLISVAVIVMLCQGDDSLSRGFRVKIEPFSEWILKTRSISVCRSTEYLNKNRLVNSDLSERKETCKFRPIWNYLHRSLSHQFIGNSHTMWQNTSCKMMASFLHFHPYGNSSRLWLFHYDHHVGECVWSHHLYSWVVV